MSRQEWIVAIVAVVVGIILIRRVWRFFTCGPTNTCDGCTKECSKRRDT